MFLTLLIALCHMLNTSLINTSCIAHVINHTVSHASQVLGHIHQVTFHMLLVVLSHMLHKSWLHHVTYVFDHTMSSGPHVTGHTMSHAERAIDHNTSRTFLIRTCHVYISYLSDIVTSCRSYVVTLRHMSSMWLVTSCHMLYTLLIALFHEGF